VRLVFGCYMSSTCKAVLPVIESYRGLLFYPAAPFFVTLDTTFARRFVTAYKARYGAGAPVPAAAEAAYFQIHLAAAAIARAGSADPERIVLEVGEIESAAPQGRVRIDPRTTTPICSVAACRAPRRARAPSDRLQPRCPPAAGPVFAGAGPRRLVAGWRRGAATVRGASD